MPPVLGNIIVIVLIAVLVFFCGRVVVRDIRGSLSGKCSGCSGCSSCGGSCASCGMNCPMRGQTGNAGKTEISGMNNVAGKSGIAGKRGAGGDDGITVVSKGKFPN